MDRLIGLPSTLRVDFEQLTNDMLFWSDTLAETEPNGTVSGGSGLTLNGTDTGINVFELDAAALAAASSLSITVPLLLVYSKNDQTVPYGNLARIAGRVSSADLVQHTLEQSDHVLTQDIERAVVYDLVWDFLSTRLD